MGALGFLDSIGITVFMSLCDVDGISDRLADHDSLSTQRYFQGKLESSPSFWIMRSQRSRRRDKGLYGNMSSDGQNNTINSFFI